MCALIHRFAVTAKVNTVWSLTAPLTQPRSIVPPFDFVIVCMFSHATVPRQNGNWPRRDVNCRTASSASVRHLAAKWRQHHLPAVLLPERLAPVSSSMVAPTPIHLNACARRSSSSLGASSLLAFYTLSSVCRCPRWVMKHFFWIITSILLAPAGGCQSSESELARKPCHFIQSVLQSILIYRTLRSLTIINLKLECRSSGNMSKFFCLTKESWQLLGSLNLVHHIAVVFSTGQNSLLISIQAQLL